MDCNTKNCVYFPKFQLETQGTILDLYLRSIFEDLTSRKLLKKKSDIYLTPEVFKQFFKMPTLISMGMFRILDKNYKKKISLDNFVEGMINILTASKHNILIILFELCDFDYDGYIYLEDVNLMYFYVKSYSLKNKNNNFSERILLEKIFQNDNLDYGSRIDYELFEKSFKNNFIVFELYYLILSEIPIIHESLDLLEKVNNIYAEYKSIRKRSLQEVYFKDDLSHCENDYKSNFIFQHEKNAPINKNLYLLVEGPNENTNTPFFISSKKNIDFSSDLGSTETSPGIIEITTLHDFSSLHLSKPPITTINIGLEKNSHLNFLNKYCYNRPTNIPSEKISKLSYTFIDQIEKQSKNICSGFIYKKTKSNKLKKFWLVLLNKDLFYFNSKKIKFKGLHTLSSSYYYESIFDSPFKNTYGFQIGFKNKKRTYYCDSLKEVQMWLNSLEKVIQYRNIYDHYEVGKLIDKTEFVEVRLMHDIEKKSTYTLKIIDKIKLKPSELDLIRNEVEVLSICQNQNIIKLVESFESSEKIYLILENIDGKTLPQYLDSSKMNLNEEQIKNIILKIAEAISYLSGFGIMHRNLQPENIIVTKDLEIKIIDFGISRIVGKGEKVNDCLGSYFFAAPEILANLSYNKEVDIWSFGVIMFYILTNELPYNDQIFTLNLYENETFFNSIFENKKFMKLCSSAQDIIKRCLSKQISRIKISEILLHSWFVK